MPLPTGRAKPRKPISRFRFIVNAVSYRLPLPVTKVIQYGDGFCYPVCPRCSESMDREYAAYCDRCGQRLSWCALSRAEVCVPPDK